MKIVCFSRRTMGIYAAIAMLAGCGGSQPGTTGAIPVSASGGLARNYAVLFSFDKSDGRNPEGGLLDVSGTLYGTTSRGGNFKNGIVYTISPTGSENLLYSFGRSPDGAGPSGALVSVGGTLYGTTRGGGAHDAGTVYSITTSGVENVLYSFAGPPDGAEPTGGLLNVNGTLYGTTFVGGTGTRCGFSEGCGTVFSVTRSGTEKVLYSFGAGRHDGANPNAGLIAVNGALYGTTVYGGAVKNCVGGNNTCGTVFSVTRSGAERVLHSFAGAPDGANPFARLLDVDGTLYGTTISGGDNDCKFAGGCGSVFSTTTTGKERVLYNFAGRPDGASPHAGLINVRGTLYGTTYNGGAHNAGVIYNVTTAGAETVVHSLAVRLGSHPSAGLIDVNGGLYGTTVGGGATFDGTVFSLKP
jgi:uncharacterized repeat protein (TIGR03803 family)